MQLRNLLDVKIWLPISLSRNSELLISKLVNPVYVCVILEFISWKVQIFQLLQRWSRVRYPHDSIPTYVLQEDARKGKIVGN